MTTGPWLWRLQSRWHRGPMKGWTWAASTLAAALLSVLAGWWLRHVHSEQAAIAAQLAHAAATAAPVAAAPAAGPARDFIADLGPVRPAEELVEEIQQAAAGTGVALIARIVFSNALFPSPWRPEHGIRAFDACESVFEGG